MTDLKEIYKTGKVMRYHANPTFNIYHQTDADHSWGCAALIFMLNPNPSVELIKAAIFHDSGEYWAGDLAHPFKAENPEIAEAHREVEFKLAKDNGVPQYSLTEEEEKWLKFVDRLEALLFCKMYSEREYKQDDWKSNNSQVVALSKELSVDLGDIL